MNPALWISKTGLDAQQTRMAVISNNLANVSTTGYKRERAVFEDLFYQNIRQPGGQTSLSTALPTGLQVGTGVRVVATEKLHTQGNISQTDNALDVAIQGRGFFQIALPDGNIAYTRDGSFKISATGGLVTSSGYELQPNINVPAGAQSIEIGADGSISAQLDGATAPTQLGNLQIVDFINPAGLQPLGENLYQETVASGAGLVGLPSTQGLGTLRQGFLETSNVNIVEEMVGMIETQRAYEMNSKAISTTDDMLQYLNNNV
ncbi:MAG: flagellar basal-body rod protein FlgG [Gammaproteobacteria bacterium]|nr:flagellar basal-body rod protein FlgG [Gammaproteobacteria bacterium]